VAKGEYDIFVVLSRRKVKDEVEVKEAGRGWLMGV
jgi:hypothetical protein